MGSLLNFQEQALPFPGRIDDSALFPWAEEGLDEKLQTVPPGFVVRQRHLGRPPGGWKRHCMQLSDSV